MNESDNCVFCESENTTRHEDVETFTYGADGHPQLEIKANVIVSGCIDCGQQWTDHKAEEARTEAIINALYGKFKEYCGHQKYMCEILNSGNGTYRP